VSAPAATEPHGDWEHVDCPVCDGTAFEPLFVKAGEPFVRCRRCTLMLINPRPPVERLLHTYDEDYSELYLAKTEKKLRRCRRWVKRIMSRVPGGRWLDVGCSAGYVLHAASEAGYAPYGIDVDSRALQFARQRWGLTNLVCGGLENQDWPDGYFQVISLYDVLEHIPRLNEFMARLARLLDPNGVIEIRTPDAGHFRVPRNLSSWPEIKPSEHLYYFDLETLSRLLARHGLRITKRRLSLKPGLKVYAVRK
jgi:2-polyprenyl-3-methyl-5-hydroxy-6-metoxy-1,4-benzoquinol methylase